MVGIVIDHDVVAMIPAPGRWAHVGRARISIAANKPITLFKRNSSMARLL